MIVRDEEARLAACLSSVRGFVDEMVVVDTGSKDRSVAIAKAEGAVVHSLPWPGDFAAARNAALRWVRGDWVLVLDADEQLRSQAIPSLREAMAQPDGLLITLLRQECGSLQSPYSNVSRLFRRHPAIHWSGAYHALVDDSVESLLSKEPQWRVLHCPEPALLHEGYRPEAIQQGEKARRLRDAMEAELRRAPTDPYICAKLGGLEISGGNHARGIALLQRGLAHCPAGAHPERYELLLHLALASASRDPKAAVALYRQALALPLDPRLTLAARLNLSTQLLDGGLIREAVSLAQDATRLAPELAHGWLHLGLSLRRSGDLPGAIAAYRQGLAIEPTRGDAHQNLAVALLLAGDVWGARRHFGEAIGHLASQGRLDEAEALRSRASALVKLEP
ncbi:MAG: glycosyltransferase [Cyanobacteriota bacterium]|nr:glycosyltransferase [Cyanobacteriota bacterium]